MILQLTCVLSLQRVLTWMSSLAAGIVVVVIMVPLAQIQSIGDVRFWGWGWVKGGVVGLVKDVLLSWMLAAPPSSR